MADSNITKRALATALKELMEEKAFEKISVGDICDKCNMNCKSFYYHFKDKYDLVNWIFDTEFLAGASKKAYDDKWEILVDACQFFYDNRYFYRKALCIKGQNSFSDHFRELLIPVVSNSIQDTLGIKNIQEFQINFFTDAYILAIQRWILEYTDMLPSEFLEQLRLCIKCAAARYEELEQ